MKRYHLFPSELQVLQLFSFKIFHCFFSGGMKGCLGPQQHLYWFHSKHTTKQRIKGHYVRLHSADLFLQLMLGYILTTNSQILQLTFYLPCINWIQYLLLLTSWCRWEGPKLWIYVDDMIPWFISFHFLHWRRFISPLSTKEKKLLNVCSQAFLRNTSLRTHLEMSLLLLLKEGDYPHHQIKR